LCLSVACSSGGASGDAATGDLAKPVDARADSAVDAGEDASFEGYLWPDHSTTDGSPTSPFQEARGLIHMHSIYSHDACDGEPFINSQPNAQCLKELRDAICANKLDFVVLTDHPSHMSDHTMEEDLLYDASAGDQLVLHQGKPIANRITCSGGQQALVSVGFESKHMMPLGLFDLPQTSTLYDGIDDSSNLTQVKQQVQGLKALGAVVAMVHSEEADISAATINAAGFEAMEWYNIHANFSALIGEDLISVSPSSIAQLGTLIDKLVAMNDFMVVGTGGPHPDLSYLVFLDLVPKAGFDKWRTVLGSRHITGILGSDIHRNVSVDSETCAGAMQVVCAGALALLGASPTATASTPMPG
jgi:hypothetical protein